MIKKKYLSNVVLLGFFVIACIFVCLFDEKLDRHEIDVQGRKEINEMKEKENNQEMKNGNSDNLDNPQIIEVHDNNKINDENNGIETAGNLLKA